jgi:hypothetical protein
MGVNIPTRPQVIPAQRAAQSAIVLVWLLGALLVFMSWFGSYIPLVVGWRGALAGSWPAGWDGAGALYSVGYQMVASTLQVGAISLYRTTRSSAWLLVYALTLAFSGVPSLLTYWGAAGAWLTSQVGGDGRIAFVVMVVAIFMADWMPEKIFLQGSGGGKGK